MSLAVMLCLVNRNAWTQGGVCGMFSTFLWSHMTVLLGINVIPSFTGPTCWCVRFSFLASVPVTCTSSTQKYGVSWAVLYRSYTTSCQQTALYYPQYLLITVKRIVRFEVLTVELLMFPVFWTVMPYQMVNTRWFKYDRDWFVCKQAALRSSCATFREWSHNLHPPSCSG